MYSYVFRPTDEEIAAAAAAAAAVTARSSEISAAAPLNALPLHADIAPYCTKLNASTRTQRTSASATTTTDIGVVVVAL